MPIEAAHHKPRAIRIATLSSLIMNWNKAQLIHELTLRKSLVARENCQKRAGRLQAAVPSKLRI